MHKDMALLQVLCRTVIIFLDIITVLANICGTNFPSGSPSQDLVFGLVGQQWSNHAKSGIDDALDKINNRSDLLSGYKLKYFQHTTANGPNVTESQNKCTRGTALKELFGQMFNSSHQIVALIGMGCSTSTEATTQITQYYNIIELSCRSSLYKDNGTMLPYYFQLLPSEVNLAHVFYSIIKEYGWRRVALIVQNEHRYKAMARSLKFMFSNSAEDTAIDYTETVLDHERSGAGVMKPEARIFVLATDSRFARKLICEAHRLGMRYPKHLFLTYGSYEFEWWTKEDDNFMEESNCSPEDRDKVLEFSLAALYFPSSHFHNGLRNVSLSDHEQRIHSAVSNTSGAEFYHLCYDAVIALALSLNKTIEELSANQSLQDAAKEQTKLHQAQNFQITDFNYNVDIVAKLIKKHLNNVNFIGLSGPVHFDKNGIRDVTELKVYQYRRTHTNSSPVFSEEFLNSSHNTMALNRKLRLIEVATIRNNIIMFSSGDKDSIWPGYTPIDGIPKISIASKGVIVTILFIPLNIGGVAFAIVCLVFNVLNRNKKVIRLSSANLNYLIICGTILIYFSGVSLAIPTANPQALLSLCFIPFWLLEFGYLCAFGTVTAKQWRVYYIFKNPYKKKGGIQDWHLLLLVFILLLISTIIFCLYILLEGIIDKFSLMMITNKEKPLRIEGTLAIQTNLYIYSCSSHRWIGQFLLGLNYGINGILQTISLYFAFQISKIRVKGLNDAKYTTALAYVITIVAIVCSVAGVVLNYNYINVSSTIYGIATWMMGTSILGFVFIPKMVSLYKDPEGVNVFAIHDVTSHAQVTLATLPTSPQIPSWDNQEADSLRKRVSTLEKAIVEYKKMTGLDLTKKQLTTSVSMICIHAQGSQNEFQKIAKDEDL